MGEALQAALGGLASSADGALIGQVRGSGLFVGIEFVRDRSTLEPASLETSLLCSRLKEEHHILTSIDGPHDNVIVMKPPLSFAKVHADRFVSALRHELRALSGADLSAVTHTPT